MRLIDVHCHLQSDVLRPRLSRIISDAEAVGIEKFITCATAPDDWNACRDVSSGYECVSFALGIHPWYIPDNAVSFLDSLSESDFTGAVAIGETGLDSRHPKHPMDLQILIFRKQLELASDLNLPVIIHCMGAWQELHHELKSHPLRQGGIIHNFNGSRELADTFTGFGISFSIGGTLTYRDSVKRADMIRSIYPDNLLLETDSPDIPPREKKGMINEPSNIIYALKAASEILCVDENDIAETTSKNADRLFFSY